MFSNIDKMYCINLRHREDRHQEAREELETLGILDQVHFHRVERHPINGCYGCFESHLWCMKDAVKNGYENILIFEDDLKLLCDETQFKINQQCVEQIMSENTFDWINLGYVHALFTEQEFEHYYKGRFTVATASIWSRRFFSQVADIVPDEDRHTNDDFFCYKATQSYFLKTPFFIQRASKSDCPWDNGQNKHKTIWEDIHIRKNIDYEKFQMMNHDLNQDQKGKLSHFLHVFIKQYLYEQQQKQQSSVCEDVAGLFLDVLEQPDFRTSETPHPKLYNVINKIVSNNITV